MESCIFDFAVWFPMCVRWKCMEKNDVPSYDLLQFVKLDFFHVYFKSAFFFYYYYIKIIYNIIYIYIIVIIIFTIDLQMYLSCIDETISNKNKKHAPWLIDCWWYETYLFMVIYCTYMNPFCWLCFVVCCRNRARWWWQRLRAMIKLYCRNCSPISQSVTKW